MYVQQNILAFSYFRKSYFCIARKIEDWICPKKNLEGS
uniref:Uncharacterized protein n=1 Tax=Arundo donax TaxID=35708 RepID=A0A0A9A5E7_ARUDO